MAMNNRPDDFDGRAFRDALGGFCTGITVVSGLDPTGRAVGITVNSFNSVSLAPPLVLFSLDRMATSLPAFAPGQPFAVMVLAEDQMDWSRHFASAQIDKWANVPHIRLENGCLALTQWVALFEGRIIANHDGGDHVIMIGQVDKIARDGNRAPLLYFNGRYARLRTE